MEEDQPRRADVFAPRPLDALSLDDLAAYRAALEAEIGRVDAEAAVKARRRDAAAALFRTG